MSRPVNGAFCSPSAWIHLVPISLGMSLIHMELFVGKFDTAVVKNPKLAHISF